MERGWQHHHPQGGYQPSPLFRSVTQVVVVATSHILPFTHPPYASHVPDHVFGEESSSLDIFTTLVEPIIDSVMEGINGVCMRAYVRVCVCMCACVCACACVCVRACAILIYHQLLTTSS